MQGLLLAKSYGFDITLSDIAAQTVQTHEDLTTKFIEAIDQIKIDKEEAQNDLIIQAFNTLNTFSGVETPQSLNRANELLFKLFTSIGSGIIQTNIVAQSGIIPNETINNALKFAIETAMV